MNAELAAFLDMIAHKLPHHHAYVALVIDWQRRRAA
jgi:hypothetical protein